MRGESGRVAERVRNLLQEHGAASAEDDAISGGAAQPPPSPPGLWARLAARVPARLDPGRRVAIAIGVAVAVAAVLTGAWVLAARPSALPVSSSGPASVASGPSGSAAPPVASGGASATAGGPPPGGGRPPATAPAELVVVDVAGKVRHPGLYRLPAGARVDDAVRAAGGALPRVKLDSLNLAAKLVDGQQIAVGVPAAAGGGVGGSLAGGSAGAGSAGGGPAIPVDLNSAGPEELQTLPGVGPVLAQHIVDWRTAHGRFASVDQLDDVPGIGDVKFAALKPLVSV